MKGRPVDPTRKRRATGNRPKPGEAKKATKASARTTARSKSNAGAELARVIHLPPQLEPPADLPEQAHPIWREAVAEIEGKGLKMADLEAIRQMCMAALRARQAAKSIEEFGLLVAGQRGAMVNPMLKVEKDATATYLRLAEQYGLTIASRLRLGLMQLAGESMLSQLNRDLEG